jgi:hypothetical protein
MAHARKDQLTRSPEWWRHLRWAKRVFWKAERKAARRDAVKRVEEACSPT